jgi:hypothetical protein
LGPVHPWALLNRDDALIVVGWLQGYYLDEHETPVFDFTKLLSRS